MTDRRNEPDWVAHAIWWQIYPLGFTGADTTGENRAPAGTLRQLIGWLDYAIELGASGILLGPIFASATHGYDTTDYLQIDPRLGNDADFDQLIEAAHERGLKVLLDGVFNHVAYLHPSFQEVLNGGPSAPRANWFHMTWPADPDSPERPDYRTFEGHGDLIALNHESSDVVDYVTEVMNHWLDRGADGWRLDAAYAVPTQFWSSVLPSVKEQHPDAYIVGEVIHGDYDAIVTESGMHAVTQYELWKAMWSAINDANFFELAWAMERHNGYLDTFVPLTFVGNHDVTRIASQLIDERHIAHTLVILFTTGGTPSLYYGDEQAFRGVKEDRPGGDDEVRPRFPGDPADLAPFGWPTYHLHQQLISIRRRHPWLHGAKTQQRDLSNEQFSFTVSDGDQRLVVALNISDGEWFTAVPGDLELLAGSDGTVLRDGGIAIPGHGWAIVSGVA